MDLQSFIQRLALFLASWQAAPEITFNGVVILGNRPTNYHSLNGGLPVHNYRSDPQEEPSPEPEIKS